MMVIQDHHSIGYAYFMVTYGILWVISELVLKKARPSLPSGSFTSGASFGKTYLFQKGYARLS